jgi:signal peptidase II
MKSVTKLGWGAYALAAVIVVLDQLLKAWILNGLHLPDRPSLPLLGPLHLTMVWNEGVSFGLLQGKRWPLVIFSAVVAGLLANWARKAERPLTALGLGLIIGGAIGNAIDRARFGAVVDFLDVRAIGFFPWIFNLADSAITVGVILLLADSLRRERPAEPVGSSD